MTVDAPGIYQLDWPSYLADPCPAPSLSSGIAGVLCLSSPAHARHQHPRLNPDYVGEHAGAADIGTAAHELLLEGTAARVVVVDAADWRTNAAKAQRDEAYATGRIPLLAHVWTEAQAMVAALRPQLERHRDGGKGMFLDGDAEQTLIWIEDGVWCRARLDWLRDADIDDYKTTSGSANPDDWTRNLFANGQDIQVAWYLRGYKALTGTEATFRFAVQETYPPYAASVISLGPDAMTLAEKRVLYALELWRACLDSNDWTGYPRRTAYATLPPWIESAWLEKEMR